MRWDTQHIWEYEKYIKPSSGNLKGKRHMEYLSIDRRIILRQTLKNKCADWIQLARLVPLVAFCKYGNLINFVFHKSGNF